MKKKLFIVLLTLLMLAALLMQPIGVVAAELLPGDVNADGEFNSDDAIYLLKYVFKPTGFPIPEGMDMDNNSDGEINADDAIYLLKAVFSPATFPLKPVVTETTYTVTYYDWNGDLITTETVKEGDSATPPTDVSREGYTFIGWDKNYVAVTGDTVLTAQYVEASKPYLKADSVVAAAGDTTVTVKVSIKNNPG